MHLADKMKTLADKAKAVPAKAEALVDAALAKLDDVDARVQDDPDFIERTRGEGPASEVAANELMEQLNAAMQKLSADHRLVVTLYDIQGLSHAEIAKITNSSEGTVRSRLYYARLQLQQLLKRYLPERH